MEMTDQKKILNGKKQFYLFSGLNVGTMMFSDFILRSKPGGLVYIVDIVLLILMYCGFMWTWYFFVGLSMLASVLQVILIAVLVREAHWMIYACPGRLVQEGMWIAACLMMYALAIFGKDMEYFVEAMQAERKKKSGSQEVNQEDSRER